MDNRSDGDIEYAVRQNLLLLLLFLDDERIESEVSESEVHNMYVFYKREVKKKSQQIYKYSYMFIPLCISVTSSTFLLMWIERTLGHTDPHN